MAKHISHPKIGVQSILEQAFFKLFSPSNHRSDNVVNFVAPPQTAELHENKSLYHADMPAEQPKQRLKKENTFNLSEQEAQIKPETTYKPEYNELKPEIKLMHTGFNIAVNFANNFKLQAKIYSRRGFEKDFKFLALDSFSPYMDNRPKLDANITEVREYQVIFCDEEREVGKMSEIVKISI